MSNIPKFYHLEHGWANKYYWLDIKEEVFKGMNFEKWIKKRKLTFSKRSGTTPADMHGSTLALDFYSKNFIEILNKNNANFLRYKINFVPELKNIGSYYFIEIRDRLPCKNTLNKTTFKLKNWRGEKLFTLKGTKFTIVSEDLKNILEKSYLKNVIFEEIPLRKGIYDAYNF